MISRFMSDETSFRMKITRLGTIIIMQESVENCKVIGESISREIAKYGKFH
jgi:hypothetical protein